MNPHVVSSLSKLIHLKLIEFEFYQTNNHQISENYKFTKFGRLIGLLISYKTDKIKISKNLYNHIIDFYDSMDHSFAKLCSIFFRRCHNTPTYDKTIKNLVDFLENANDDKNLFMNQIKKYTPILSKESWDILYDSFYEFDKRYPLKYEVLFYNLKLYLEEIHERKSRNLIGFEKWRFLLINEPFEATLEGYCNNCYKYSIVRTGIINYFVSYANTNSNDRSNHMVITCPNPDCKNGFLDLEFIDKMKFIKETQNATDTKKKYIQAKVFENKLDIVGTIFEHTKKGYTIKANRLKQY